MKISKKGIDLIKKYEGFRNHPYLDPVGIPTIGYGTTYYTDGTMVKMTDPPVTIISATHILYEIVEEFEIGVWDAVSSVCLEQNQFDALVSFAYNVGLGVNDPHGRRSGFLASTLLKRVLADPNDPDIDFQFKRWNKAGGKVLKGLKKRRNEEAWLYFEHLRNG